MGLLGEIFSASDSLKRRVKGLLSDPIGYLQQLDDQAKNYNNNVRPVISGGLLDNRPLTEKEKQQQAMELVMNLAPIGMTVWHGSPHKFTKFDMSKIGTGEGAQAYGHGLYVAESPEVAQNYADFVKRITPLDLKDAKSRLLKMETDNWKRYKPSDIETQRRIVADYEKRLADKSVYKVDIPDEAVARMLDWDKPLSQQAPEVQKVLNRIHKPRNEYEVIQREPYFKNAQFMVANKKTGNGVNYFPTQQEAEAFISKMAEDSSSGMHIYNNIGKDAHKVLQEAGIPGIRYLDGGSRSAGQGSSNFVLFDDQLPRILEINGQATGNAPWKPGEWRGLLSP